MPDTAEQQDFELRPSDGVNLADERIPCPECLGALEADERPCGVCRARGSVSKPTGRDHLSNSSISTQLSCLKKFDWHYMHRLELLERPRPLGMGAAFQRGIELSDPAAGLPLLRQGRSLVTQEDEDKLSVDEAIVRAAATLYLDRFGTPAEEAREVEYRVRLRSPWTGRPSMTYDLLGYADGVLEAPEWLELVENKLVGKLDGVSLRKLPLDRQVGLGCYGLWRAKAKPVRVVHYRFTKKPSIRQRQKESVAEFCERVAADYEERPDFYSHEETLFRSDADLLQIEAELWDWADQLRSAKKRDFYARNTSTCHEYGGCQFIPLCVGDEDARALYRERPSRELHEEVHSK